MLITSKVWYLRAVYGANFLIKEDVIKERIDLLNLTRSELDELVSTLGQSRYRAEQIYSWIYSKGVLDINEMSDLSKEFRSLLQARCRVGLPGIVDIQRSADNTIKFVSSLFDGARVESVLIPDTDRMTLCISSQTGCVLACAFCLTGSRGAGRDLALAEFSAQYFNASSLTKGRSITNIVMMGMGEPLLNCDAVFKFLAILVDQKGLAIAPRRVTLSTAGVLPGIKRLSKETKVNLALSLNATTDEVRDRLMPINRKYPIAELMAALRGFSAGKSRYITIEYVLIKDVNDSPADALRLVKLLAGLRVKVNLIPYNPHPASRLERPGEERVASFKDILHKRGLIAVIRLGRGADILAACGQLGLDASKQRAHASCTAPL